MLQLEFLRLIHKRGLFMYKNALFCLKLLLLFIVHSLYLGAFYSLEIMPITAYTATTYKRQLNKKRCYHDQIQIIN